MGEFEKKLSGSFAGILTWEALDRLWARIGQEEGWHICALGSPAPKKAASPARLRLFLEAATRLLKEEHGEDYCGIVYADDLERPTMVKIYDPAKIGSSCSRGKPYPPGWVLGKDRPEREMEGGEHVDARRRRWWEDLSEKEQG